MELILLYVGSYLLGSVPFGFLIGKLRGIDIRKVGSGNTGATNTYRALGPVAGITVFLLDVAKGAAAPIVSQQILSPEPAAIHSVFLGIVAVLGHTYSPFLRFKGGKGVATGLGGLLGTAPLVGLCGFGAFLVSLAITRYVSISSIFGCLTVVVAACVTRQSPLFIGVYGIAATYVISRHAPNMRRIANGTEPKVGQKKKEDEESP